MTFSVEAGIKFYKQNQYEYIEESITYTEAFNVKLTGKLTANVPIGKFKMNVVPGTINITLEPKIVVEAEGEVGLDFSITGSIGFQASTAAKGIKNISKWPEPKLEIKAEAKFFVGVEMEPKFEFTIPKIAEIGFAAKGGLEISATMSDDVLAGGDIVHDCGISCVDGDVNFVSEFKFKTSFLNKTLTFERTIASASVKVADFYYSFKYKTFDFTECPYFRYAANIRIVDKNGTGIPNASISLSGETEMEEAVDKEATTDSYGYAKFMLSPGNYGIYIYKAGVMAGEREFNIHKLPRNITVNIEKDPSTVVTLVDASAENSAALTQDGSLYI